MTWKFIWKYIPDVVAASIVVFLIAWAFVVIEAEQQRRGLSPFAERGHK